MESQSYKPHAGDSQSREDRLAALFDTCYPRLARYAYARTGDRAEAEDIAADVFLRALESIDSYQERGLPMEAWLFRIAHNLVVDRLRRSSRFDRVEDPAEELADTQDPASIAEERIRMREVREAMRSLTPQQREVVSLRFFAGLDSKEVADVLHKSSGAVREMQR
ncbi:MAG: sigma-70 family RNA polymerase sigma factor, partial [Dehalococcoidia bacterium]|nr:sigma-70 family RNA polymerase sigma factor [Dehalococcoidia bacterium]